MALQWPHPEDPIFTSWIFVAAPEITPEQMRSQSEEALIAYWERVYAAQSNGDPWGTEALRHRIIAILMEKVKRRLSPEECQMLDEKGVVEFEREIIERNRRRSGERRS